MSPVLTINDRLQLSDSEYSVTAVRSQGAGGQNVNKVATAIQLRFDIVQSSLPDDVKSRLLNLGDQRVSHDGVLVIKSQETRSQIRNLEAAKQRLSVFIRQGTIIRKKRRATKPSKNAVKKRLDNKRRRGQIKVNRRSVED